MKKLMLLIVIAVMAQVLVYSQIQVISPNGGENWNKQVQYTIGWNPGGVPGNVRIKLLDGGTVLGNIINSTGNSGSFDWTIDKLTNGNPIPTGDNFKIRIISLSNTAIRDVSNAKFTISTKKNLKVSKYSNKQYPVFLPDLRPSISATDFKAYEWTYITLTIHNDGKGMVNSGGKTLLKVFYSGPHGQHVFPGQLVTEWKYYNYNIPAKSSFDIKQKTNLFNTRDGLYYIEATVDATGVVTEVEEDNNIKFITYNVNDQ
jgi:hypothetical protein